jgi:hypothetical protein
MEQELVRLLEKMATRTLTAEEVQLLEEKAKKFSSLNQLAEARHEWREALRKVNDARENNLRNNR